MKKSLILLAIVAMLFNTHLVNNTRAGFLTADDINKYVKETYPKEYPTKYLLVSVPTQTLYLVNNQNIEASYPISTAKKGVGNIINSNKTPLGLHKIVNKIGSKADIGTVIRKGVVTKEKATIITEAKSINTDILTTRVMWLSGMESGVNRGGRVDSLTRGIMIHGTPEEGLIGTPTSHGCIRMKNQDIIDLFDKVDKNTKVIIENKF